ncbi:MAG: heat-inducible transcriptional repressor HrcA [Thermodesulfobacteriota bacterium]
MDSLNERKRSILKAVIREYISSNEPVSSRLIAERAGLSLSPASIRKIMADLVDLGYLVQPHTSAGRVPAMKSFRYYHDSLLKLEEPLNIDKERLCSIFKGSLGAKDWVENTTKALSKLTSSAVMAISIKSKSFMIKHIGVMRIDAASVMVVIAGANGEAYTKLVRIDPSEIERMNFERISNYLNDIAAGLSIIELKKKIVREMHGARRLYNDIMENALRLSAEAIEDCAGESESFYHVEGRSNIFDQLEFSEDLEKMKRIFSVFEDHSILVKILEECMSSEGVRVFLGSESPHRDLAGLSFVTTPFSFEGVEGGFGGTLGVIGPVWMNYPKIIPLVGYTASLFERST